MWRGLPLVVEPPIYKICSSSWIISPKDPKLKKKIFEVSPPMFCSISASFVQVFVYPTHPKSTRYQGYQYQALPTATNGYQPLPWLPLPAAFLPPRHPRSHPTLETWYHGRLAADVVTYICTPTEKRVMTGWKMGPGLKMYFPIFLHVDFPQSW